MGPSLLHVAFPILLDVAADPTARATARALRLDDAVAAGLRDHPSRKQASAQTAAAKARADEAKAPLFPQLTGVASYQRVRRANFAGTGLVTGGTGATGSGATGGGTANGATPGVPSAIATVTDPGGVDVFTFGGSMTQLIWDFGKTYQGYRAAARLASSVQTEEKVTAQSVVAVVRRAYFTARAQRAMIVVASESLTNTERHLVQISGLVEVGTRPEIDLAQAKTDVANARATLIDAENAYVLAKAQLAQGMGDSSGADFEVIDDELPPIEGEELPADVLYERALRARPEVVSLEQQREAQELSVRAATGGYFPALSASGGASETGTAIRSLGPAWNVGINLTWQVFQGGLTRGVVREARANLAAVNADLETTRLQVRVDVVQAAQNIRAAKETYVASSEAAVNARERLRLAEGRYTSGLGNAIELGDAQLAVTIARSQVVQARFRLSTARADLLTALGRR